MRSQHGLVDGERACISRPKAVMASARIVERARMLAADQLLCISGPCHRWRLKRTMQMKFSASNAARQPLRALL